MTIPSAPMRQAIEGAFAVRGTTSPNPWVGAVVVRDGVIVARGATSPYGGAHAEAAALANIDARGADLYTTLEPCMPFEGKKTPPCAEVIVQAGIQRVVVGLQDPHAPVRGAGVEFLRSHGIQVEVGDGGEAITELLRPYLKFRQTGKPYIIAKFASSLDGKLGAPAAGITWLTSEAAIRRTHRDRAWVDAIVVGSGTVMADDPMLSARDGNMDLPRQPLRVVLDGRGRSEPRSRVFRPGTIVASASRDEAWRKQIVATGATILELEHNSGGLNLTQLFRVLGQRNVMSLVVEGGPTLLESLFRDDHIDEVHAYIAPLVLGASGISLVPGTDFGDPVTLREAHVEPLPPDLLIRGYTGSWSPEPA
ncbi:MAG: bifunctional diaminohydroxyphosphoribosylaminopyrimidine deaminase/5-amino-6-(5-phosphoribosylamino)uracil reductase RibD [Dehalococcoidia bacterium]